MDDKDETKLIGEVYSDSLTPGDREFGSALGPLTVVFTSSITRNRAKGFCFKFAQGMYKNRQSMS